MAISYEDLETWAVRIINNQTMVDPEKGKEAYTQIVKDIEELGDEGAKEKWSLHNAKIRNSLVQEAIGQADRDSAGARELASRLGDKPGETPPAPASEIRNGPTMVDIEPLIPPKKAQAKEGSREEKIITANLAKLYYWPSEGKVSLKPQLGFERYGFHEVVRDEKLLTRILLDITDSFDAETTAAFTSHLFQYIKDESLHPVFVQHQSDETAHIFDIVVDVAKIIKGPAHPSIKILEPFASDPSDLLCSRASAFSNILRSCLKDIVEELVRSTDDPVHIAMIADTLYEGHFYRHPHLLTQTARPKFDPV